MVYSKEKGWPKQYVLNCGRSEARKNVFERMREIADSKGKSLQDEIWLALQMHVTQDTINDD